MTNLEVVKAWIDGKAGKAGNLSTDGVSLYSYTVQIGETTSSGVKTVYDYTKGGSHGWKSQTTSKHVRLAQWLTE